MSYSVETIKIDSLYTGDIITATISGTHTVDLSTSNIFVFNLSANTTLEFTDAKQSAYNFLVKAGTYSITLGTASNWLLPDGDNISATGSLVISGIYDGTDMWVASQENYTNI